MSKSRLSKQIGSTTKTYTYPILLSKLSLCKTIYPGVCNWSPKYAYEIYMNILKIRYYIFRGSRIWINVFARKVRLDAEKFTILFIDTWETFKFIPRRQIKVQMINIHDYISTILW